MVTINGTESSVDSVKLRHIESSDNISFDYNYEVLNACFGANMRDSLRVATWNSHDGCLVWFPHHAVLKNGRYEPGSTEVNWKNYFEDEGNIIIQMLYPDEMVNANDKEPIFRKSVVPMHTFMKMGTHDYRYVGTYMLDYMNSTPRYQMVRRIKDGIDLSVWASGYDTDYFDTTKIGKDVFKGFYLGKNFSKQKEYINSFLENEKALIDEEQAFNTIKEDFLNEFGMASIRSLGDERFNALYIEKLTNAINELFNSQYTKLGVRDSVGTWSEFGRVWADLLFDEDESINDRIRNCPWGPDLASKVFALYDENSIEFLYTIPEREIDRMLFAIGIEVDSDADLIEKQSKLYFWRFCDDELIDWSIFRYYQFLRFIADVKKQNVRFISAAKPDVTNRIIAEEKAIEEELSNDGLLNVPQKYEYDGIPRPREININAKRAQGAIVPRHQDRKINALVRAGFACEIDSKHPTFKRRNSNKNYTETHHLIPLEYSAQFEYTLDTEENIVSLCSNCHNQIHYGDDAEELIKKLYDERREALAKVKLDKTINGIDVDYQQLLHMYGLD